MAEPTIEDYLLEERTFAPSAEFAGQALVRDRSLYDEAEADYQAFWARQARQLVTWFRDFDQVLDWDLPFAKWFVGGQLNVSYNCLDRHLEAGRGDQVAYHWEGEPGDTRTITYAELSAEVNRFANVLHDLGVNRGDRVGIYMPMIPELPVAMLACTRIGAAHSCIFGGFSPDSIIDRVNDAQAKVLVTADGGFRRGAPALLKPAVDLAVRSTPSMTAVVVVQRVTDHPASPPGTEVEMVAGRDHWYHELMADASTECAPEPMDSEDLLYLLYTSGTTAKPKGIMHTTGGYLTQVAFTHKYVFDLHPETRRLLVRGRHRLGHRPQLHRVRTAGQRGHLGHLRGHARHARPRPVVVHRRALRRHPAVHRAHRHPHLHEVGRPGAGGPRPVQPPGAGHGG